MPSDEDFNTSRNSPGRTDGQRQADALEKIAQALEVIAGHLAPVVTGTPDTGWIDWPGGECPVPNGTRVDVRFRDGRVWPDQQAWGYDSHFEGQTSNTRAGSAYWSNDNATADIIEAQSKALAEAREALKPFAIAAERLDQDDAWRKEHGFEPHDPDVVTQIYATRRQVRAARAALTPENPNG